MGKEIINLLICCISSHLIGDFIFQFKFIAEKKNENYFILVLHAFIHTLVFWIICGIWNNFILAVYIFLSHLTIDFIKSCIFSISSSLKENPYIFIGDQILHFLSIFLLVVLYPINNFLPFWELVFNKNFYIYLIVICGLIITGKVGEFIIPYYLQKLKTELEQKCEPSIQGFIEGGKILGHLERIMIFFFIFLNKAEAIGLLITAKSIFRFLEKPNCDISKTRLQIEYIIIGSFLSFTYALITTVITIELINLY